MHHTTRAIVLHRTPYNERHSIVHLYTLELGRVGVLVPSSSRGRSARHLLSCPLGEVEITLSLRPRSELAQLGEVRLVHAHHSLQLDPRRTQQALLISELLYRLLQAREADEALYSYLSHSALILSQIEAGLSNFTLCFCLHLLRHLAISPDLAQLAEEGHTGWFDLRQVTYLNAPDRSGDVLTLEESRALRLLCRMHYGNMHLYRYTQGQRRQILDRLLQYYRLHLPPFPALKSLAILRSSQLPLPEQIQGASGS